MNDEQILNQLNGDIAWKDSQLRYLGCNANFSKSLFKIFLAVAQQIAIQPFANLY